MLTNSRRICAESQTLTAKLNELREKLGLPIEVTSRPEGHVDAHVTSSQDRFSELLVTTESNFLIAPFSNGSFLIWPYARTAVLPLGSAIETRCLDEGSVDAAIQATLQIAGEGSLRAARLETNWPSAEERFVAKRASELAEPGLMPAVNLRTLPALLAANPRAVLLCDPGLARALMTQLGASDILSLNSDGTLVLFASEDSSPRTWALFLDRLGYFTDAARLIETSMTETPERTL